VGEKVKDTGKNEARKKKGESSASFLYGGGRESAEGLSCMRYILTYLLGRKGPGWDDTLAQKGRVCRSRSINTSILPRRSDQMTISLEKGRGRQINLIDKTGAKSVGGKKPIYASHILGSKKKVRNLTGAEKANRNMIILNAKGQGHQA